MDISIFILSFNILLKEKQFKFNVGENVQCILRPTKTISVVFTA